MDLPSQILWGTGLENVLAFDYPALLDNKRHWRRPAPGSERARNSAGVTDASVTGYDYMLAGRARWFNSALWSGGPGIQEFLDWAGRGNVFRFVPDKNAPNFYVDNVTLDEPFEDPAPDLEEADGSQALDLVLRNPTVDFGQALRGIMFEYAPGASLTDPVAATFSRASAATRRGLPGNLAAAVGATDAAGVLRDRHYEGTLRTTLLEAARTQLVTDPENFGAWNLRGTPTRTGGQADPFGGTAAYLLSDDDAASSEGLDHAVTFTGNDKTYLLFIRVGTADGLRFRMFDSVGAALRLEGSFTSSTKTLAITSGSGTAFTPIPWGGGWFVCAISMSAALAVDVLEIFVGLTAASTGSMYIFGANAWNAPFPSSYQGPSLASRSADALSWPFTHKPQPGFLYAKFVERGTIAMGGGTRLLQVGSGAGTKFWNFYSSGLGSAGYGSSFQDIVLPQLASPPTIGQVVELLAILRSDGSIEIRQSKDGGAEITSGASGSAAFPATWNDLLLNQAGGGFSAQALVKVGPLAFGGKTIDTIAKARAA